MSALKDHRNMKNSPKKKILKGHTVHNHVSGQDQLGNES